MDTPEGPVARPEGAAGQAPEPKLEIDCSRQFPEWLIEQKISLAFTTTQVLTVTPSLPVNNVRELVDLVKANPGKYSYASAGIGTPAHMTAELLRISQRLGVNHQPKALTCGTTAHHHFPRQAQGRPVHWQPDLPHVSLLWRFIH